MLLQIKRRSLNFQRAVTSKVELWFLCTALFLDVIYLCLNLPFTVCRLCSRQVFVMQDSTDRQADSSIPLPKLFWGTGIHAIIFSDKSGTMDLIFRDLRAFSGTSPGFYVYALAFTFMQYMSFENAVGKGEIAPNEQFLLFPQCFLP